MLRNKLVRSDGSIIDSSVIISCEFTEEVNCNTNLSFGDVTASELAVEIRDTEVIQQGEVLTYYMIEDGVETLIGEFIAEKPTVASRSSIRFSAYDNISKTEKPFSGWLRDNQALFPMTPMELLSYACSYCGVIYAGGEFPNQNITVNKFYADDITCRQILSWVGALAGRFVRATATGEIELAQYTENSTVDVTHRKGYTNPVNIVVTDTDGNVVITSDEMTVTDDGYGNVIATIEEIKVIDEDGNVTLAKGVAVPYMQGSLSYETYQTDTIDRVQIKHSDNDVGVIYPAEATGNCYVISQNMLLGACSTEDVTTVAQTLYEQMRSVTYVPFSVTLPRTLKVRAGEIIGVRDINGHAFVTLVMKMSVAPNGVTISSTGDKSYGSTAAVASEKFTNLTGKVLEMSKTVDGLIIKNRDLDGKVSGLELTVDGYKTYVEENFVSDDGFEEKYKSVSEQTTKEINDHFEALDKFKNDTTANIKTGLLGYTDDPTPIPIYGVEIGQETKNANGETVFDASVRIMPNKMAFYDQSDNEVASVGDKKMSIGHVEITGIQTKDGYEYGSFKQGKFVDTTRADGTIVSKWVGGE
jgi:hypothetical protein